MAFKAAIRAGALKTVGSGRAGIASAESHAKRLDPVAKSRVVRDTPPIAWSKAMELPSFLGGGPLDYVAAFGAHKRLTKAEERKGSALAMEFKAVVSPDWLAEAGDPRDPANPRVQQLVTEAKAWAENWGGAGAVWAVRYDTDEKGAGVVDLFMSPVRQQHHKGGTSKAVISTRKAKEELLATEQALDPGLKTSGAAMQSSWARWCQQKLDARLERGQPKEETGKEHIHADVYAKVAEEARRDALKAVEAERQAMLAEVEIARQRAAEAAVRAKEAQERTAALEARIGPVRAAVSAFDAFQAKVAAWDAYDPGEVEDLYLVTEAKARHSTDDYGRPAVSGSFVVERATDGALRDWNIRHDQGKPKVAELLLQAFDAARKAGAELWVKVTSWGYENNNRHWSFVQDFLVVDPPAPPPAKPVIAPEVLSILSRLDEKTLKAVRDINHP
jgi:hypothetical protein